MLSGYRIALVEDDEFMGASIQQRLELEGAEVIWLKQAARAVGALRTPRARIDAVVCDIRLPDGNGEALFETLCETATPPPFLFITGHGGIEQAVRLMHAGAADYVCKPFEMSVFLERLVMLLAPVAGNGLPPILGISPIARRVEEQARLAAQTDRAVLIRGGSGTGKEQLARRIHELSDRSAAPFVAINVAREHDLETSISGAMRGTGEGIFFLHALDRLPPASVGSLLEAIDRGFAGRIVASCGLDPEEESQHGSERAELFYRLNFLEIPLPPLGGRTEDALWLALQAFPDMNARRTKPLLGLGSLCEQAIRAHDWPGGGREVKMRLSKGVQSATGTYLQPSDIFPERLAHGGHFMSLAEVRAAAERRQIIDALDHTGHKLARTAELLGISRTTLWDKMQKLGLSETPE
ncbi:sigma-54-dependent transcriptional regulator [Aliiruegeria lutimaris]|uniref:Two component, sigma54 specific, transcriptional regulator, Fis family n=1 Tax=Aliiruegeria lutimaris TaxID=571298 RepID=A0A1G8Q022_9RHOB|nr:response regulator [Aliiruegeria lutimaris]SDI98119.1 two component, sigma54 specific, transcriptional regulator, Fis family [Aliiruegeria lutimaris]